METSFLWLLLFVPLFGSACAGLIHFACLDARRAGRAADGLARLAGLVSCAAVLVSFGLSLYALWRLGGGHEASALESPAWHWIDAGAWRVEVALVADRLSSVLLLVITGVGFLIHVYSLGYMKGDPGYAKFFAYLNLFVFMMLLLVLSSSLLGLFVGWEGVGLCSYLLIGFWYEKGWPAEAGQKAFVVNRVGDASFLLGSFLLLRLFGTLDLSDLAGGAAGLAGAHAGELALAALLLFGGACGKSAQGPLTVWLPDAMAGPTPVSALIHAATMVTAGIYLVLRLAPVFATSPSVLFVVGAVGAFTALFGATTALLQRDIKKVLAYSTVSQLGFMFLGLSVGAWSAALFHLVTHAFFKGLLFLAAGSVIHGLHGEQDLTRMGGLRKHMPLTFATFLAGAAALSGLPLTSGYFSKDEILSRDFGAGGPALLLWVVGMVAAACTAFYTWRMVALTFFGAERFDAKHVHPHESPATMTGPLAILAVLSLVGGLLSLPHVLQAHGLLEQWLEPLAAPATAALYEAHGREAPELTPGLEWTLLALGAAMSIVFARGGFLLYLHGPAPDRALQAKQPGLARFLEHAWTIDESYTRRIVQPLKLGSFLLATVVDQLGIDGLLNASAGLARSAGARLRRLVDGSVKTYALWMSAGAALLVLAWMTL
jgi:NADH-quinone oxidoreductase subunit L